MDFEQLKILLEAEVGENAGRVLYTYFLTSAIGPVLGFIFGLVLLFVIYKIVTRVVDANKFELWASEWGDILGTKTHTIFYAGERDKTIKKIDGIVRSHKGKEDG